MEKHAHLYVLNNILGNNVLFWTGAVTSKSTEETLHPDQQSYGAGNQNGIPYGGAYRSPLGVVIFVVFIINLL